MPIDASQAVEGDSLHKLWASTRIKELSTSGNKNEEIKNLSVEYQVPSSQTAFIALAKNTDPATGAVELRKVPIVE